MLSSYVCLVDNILDGDSHTTILISTSHTTYTVVTMNRARLVDDKVLDSGIVSIATQPAEEADIALCGTLNNHVLDAIALSVEGAVELVLLVGTDGAVEVLDVVEVDVVHQLGT